MTYFNTFNYKAQKKATQLLSCDLFWLYLNTLNIILVDVDCKINLNDVRINFAIYHNLKLLKLLKGLCLLVD
ncbi:hypothetical protein Q783_12115 (plasmid) [Carnobacterium inhibens subsp. gilichinskyi]|uniref:Uncharacterized protein n=1 Tax=Carnobacterium inhibens subsp. gilichinskyi TaxID=1266845 RepID=U5SFZ9_9LACT|nr:hypothetical protein Q783_12115 [Carnobacterium inhibens subsp. gilichinskyi]